MQVGMVELVHRLPSTTAAILPLSLTGVDFGLLDQVILTQLTGYQDGAERVFFYIPLIRSPIVMRRTNFQIVRIRM